jgi:hypothetical protein
MKKKGQAVVGETNFVLCPAKRSCGMLIHKQAIKIHLEMNHVVDARKLDK